MDLPYLDMGLQPSTPFTTVSFPVVPHLVDPSSSAVLQSPPPGHKHTTPLWLQHASLRHHRALAVVKQAVAPLEGHSAGLAAAAGGHLLAVPRARVVHASLAESGRVVPFSLLKRRKRRQRALSNQIPGYVCDILQQSGGRIVLS